MSWEDFEPQINFITSDLYNELTFENLWQYPLGWVIILCWLLVCFSLVLLFYYCQECEPNLIDDTPLIAQENVLLDLTKSASGKNGKSDVLLANSSFKQYMVIQQIEIAQQKHISVLCKVYHLWKIKLRTDHLWFGICCRAGGTSYTTFERISVMCVRLLTTMAVR